MQNNKNDEEKAVSGFNNLGISDSILKVLSGLKLDVPTPIQEKTIPVALKGQDLIGIAQTGTGKTFAFGIPMLQSIGKSKTQGLVIAPTRELAIQVAESIKKLGTPLGLKTAVLIGGEAIDRQLFQLRKGPHIVVATPGRLLDHLKRKTFKADCVSVLVLDEADTILDFGFAPQIKEILQSMPTERQTMLFSATMPESITKLAASYMKLPVSIQVARPGTTATDIDQEIYIIRGEKRLEHLDKILTTYSGSVLVFVRTKHGVKSLTEKLVEAGHSATEIHSNLSLGRRKSALEAFKSRTTRILVATDVASRGLDINNIELVVNYNLPDNSEDYVHRIGRTARAGNKGKAITFATTSDFREIRNIEMLINMSIKKTEFARGGGGSNFNNSPAPRTTDGSGYQGRRPRGNSAAVGDRNSGNRTSSVFRSAGGNRPSSGGRPTGANRTFGGNRTSSASNGNQDLKTSADSNSKSDSKEGFRSRKNRNNKTRRGARPQSRNYKGRVDSRGGNKSREGSK